ncbi:LacI family DNA-binding transcriptional regulator [Tenacibaculum sp. IB213877]|uniref:LacI family DNA-binding transcriptional regulator n=1 Tax=Tenacibaculum sp. IB213877 TaxID=3097351 RepID=UPI002A5AAA83|nr:LacI family DNA-binding transcriptional regulator [Tenacibaculum sp. IB213877]MDY0779486.1 LacI family DNA-binding transcriptional regulator [Tenacibaculum sp. IB213877]
MKSKITIKIIAKELGVSPSTVSKALRDSHEISQETKNKIKAYAKLYNFRPNNLALQLRNQKTKVIGIVLPKIVHHFFSTVISGVERVANERGYNIMVCFSNEQQDKEVETINVLTNGSVDGLIVSIAKESLRNNELGHFHKLIQDEIPIVLFDRVHSSLNCDKVIVDDIGAGYKATKHLIDIGCKNIAIITTPEHVTVGFNRYQGYEKALKDSGISLNKKLIVNVDDDDDTEIYRQIKEMFAEKVDAVFAVNEIYAALAIRVAKDKGIEIPNELSVVGFTDGLISEYSSPSITTIVQHGFTMGEQAAELLIDRIENEKDNKLPQTKVISSNLKIRQSSKS